MNELLSIVILISILFIIYKINTIMATQEQFQIVLGRIDAATNNIAQTLKDLRDKLAGQGLPPETEDWVISQLDAAATKLEGVGKTDSTGIATGEVTSEGTSEEPVV